jgi:hypothetical protein
MRPNTLIGLLGSAILAVGTVVAGAASAAAGHQAHTSGAGRTALGKFQVNATAEQEGVLFRASGHVRYTGTTFIGHTIDLRLDVVCLNNTATASFLETRDPATGEYYDLWATDNFPAVASPDQFLLNGPFITPTCPLLGPLSGFDVIRGTVVVTDAGP